MKSVKMVLPGFNKKYNCPEAVYSDRGFTLVEVMVALAISGIVLASIYSAFQSQQNSYVAQEQVSEMQQNVRIGLDMLSKDIRLAGYNPDGSAGTGFVDGINFDAEPVNTNATRIAFTADLDGDGTIDVVTQDVDGNGTIDMSDMERIAYRLNGTNLQRFSTGAVNWQTVAENVENIEFQYVLDDGSQTTTPTAAQLANIRNVRISILVITEKSDKNYTNSRVYLPASNDPFFTSAGLSGTVWGPFTGTATVNFRRRLLKITVNCRNMGLV
ncbi:MAG: prepilin-type N-terminal cleavage/methylation domain-containing protein [Proteobacteria bacterium]|nr:prepilin-type N-terminal cleavage/methylation domain-containing protein [Pseudomonadota bacterium]